MKSKHLPFRIISIISLVCFWILRDILCFQLIIQKTMTCISSISVELASNISTVKVRKHMFLESETESNLKVSNCAPVFLNLLVIFFILFIIINLVARTQIFAVITVLKSETKRMSTLIQDTMTVTSILLEC